MIDFHSHILPKIDDGSKNVEMSIRMFSMQKEQGVDCVVATPHFYAGKETVGKFLTARQYALEEVQEQAGKIGFELPKIYLGAEVHYFEGIGDASLVSNLCIQETNILLLEMPFIQWTAAMRVDLEMLIRHQRLKVILAHIERYPEFQRDPQVWKDIMKLPLYKQMNAGAFLCLWTRRRNLALLNKNENILLGSDCHNIDTRSPNLLKGRSVIADKLGTTKLTLMDACGKELLK